MQKYKSLVLPVALILGYLFRGVCAFLAPTVPYFIFAILVLTFSGVRLSTLRPHFPDLYLGSFQTLVSAALYALIYALTSNEVLAQGAMICVLCPVASSVTVVASMLGASPVRTTTYTIIGNLLIAVVAPVFITVIEGGTGFTFWSTLLVIFSKVAGVIALPFFLVLIFQKFIPRLNNAISGIKGYSFYLWAYALLITIGQTADFAVARWQQDKENVLWLALISAVICIVQFTVGRRIGQRYGDKIAGGQLLGQKNSAIGIWMLNTFLNPVASVSMACYSIWQNIFNSWQIYRIGRNARAKEEKDARE